MSTSIAERDIIKTIEVKHSISLKDFQVTSMLTILNHETFVCVPTGSGKSFAYIFLPDLFDLMSGDTGSIVIVISPLIALMKEQVCICI